MSVCNFVYSQINDRLSVVYSRNLYRSAVVDNIRRRIVGVMFPPSIFEDRCVDFRRSMIDVSTFEDRGHDVSTFGDRCVDFRRSMCRPSMIDVSTFEDR